ncbi:MAG: hypothetical protein ACP5GA_10580, partial [Acidithiobacillus sp.]
EKGEQIVLVESDDSNPDAYKALNGIVPCEICNMDDEAGYIKLGNIIEANGKACLVVNTAARATAGMVQHGGIIVDVARELKRDLVMLWPINRQRDSLELLNDFVENAQGYTAIYAVLNTYFGDPKNFARFHASKLKTRIRFLEFPALNDLLADKLVDNRLALSNADAKLQIAERSALRRYREAAKQAFEVVYG